MKEEDKMFYYNYSKTVPAEAQKIIGGGRLKGMTDIKPMWRIEVLTELFGAVGKGWYTKTVNKEITDGANGEKIATVDIELYVKYDDEWSTAIEGSGGAMFVSSESKGLYTDDEAFKKAYTDALSVACRSLGIGADIYMGRYDSKYETPKTPTKASEAQLNYVKKLYSEDERSAIELQNGIKIDDLTGKQAYDLIEKRKKKEAK